MAGDHTAYIEVLAHVNCGNCEAYWALSDIGESAIDDRPWTCPHCGWEAEVGEVVENEG